MMRPTLKMTVRTIGGVLLLGLVLAVGTTDLVQLAVRSATNGLCAQAGIGKWALLRLSASPMVVHNECGQPIGYYGEGFSTGNIWDVSTDGALFTVSHVAKGRIPELRIYDAAGRPLSTTVDNRPVAGDIRLSPDHQYLAASGTFDPSPNRPDDFRPPVTGGTSGIFVRKLTDVYWKNLVNANVDSARPLPFSWSPRSNAVVTTVDGRITEVEIIGGKRKTLAVGCCPKWSPDGKQIAYLDERGELILQDLAKATQRRLLPGKKLVGACLEWSPDMQFMSLCLLPEQQPDPGRYISYLGMLNLQNGKYRRWGPWIWGHNQRFRWVRLENGNNASIPKILRELSGQEHVDKPSQ